MSCTKSSNVLKNINAIKISWSYLKQKLVSEHIHSELLIPERIHTGCSSTRSCSDLEGNSPQSFSHTRHQPDQALIRGCLCKELLLHSQQMNSKHFSISKQSLHLKSIIYQTNFSGTFLKLQLTRLSPISHLVTRDDCFVFEAFNDDLGTCFSDSPKRELDFRLYHNQEAPLILKTATKRSHIFLQKTCM